VVTELKLLSGRPELGTQAENALNAIMLIKAAVRSNKSIQVLTARRLDVTREALDDGADSGYETDNDREEIVRGIVQGRSDGSDETPEHDRVEAAILVSGDEPARSKTDKLGVTVIAASVIKKLLSKCRSRASSVSSKRS